MKQTLTETIMTTKKKNFKCKVASSHNRIRDVHLKRTLCSNQKGMESRQLVPSAQLSHAGLSSPSVDIIRVRQPILHEAHGI